MQHNSLEIDMFGVEQVLTSGADCSGFTMSLFKKFGYSLSRTAAEQAYNGKAVKSNKLKAGRFSILSYRQKKQE